MMNKASVHGDETNYKSSRWKKNENRLNDEERMRRALLSILEDEKLAQEKIKTSEKALKESQSKLQSLSSHLLEAQEKNWRRIALELHDELGQSLTVLKLKLRDIKNVVTSKSMQLGTKCDDVNLYVDHIIDNVRRLSHELCPSYIEDLGLDESIVILAEEFAKHTKLDISIKTQDINDCFNLQGRTFIYRIIQESLNNIQKHAEARSVSIQIERERSHIAIQIIDDGTGFDKNGTTDRVSRHDTIKNGSSEPSNNKPLTKTKIESPSPKQIGGLQTKAQNKYKLGLGLTAMAERARMLGGQLEVYSAIGMGTRIEMTVPIAERERRDEFSSHNAI